MRGPSLKYMYVQSFDFDVVRDQLEWVRYNNTANDHIEAPVGCHKN